MPAPAPTLQAQGAITTAAATATTATPVLPAHQEFDIILVCAANWAPNTAGDVAALTISAGYTQLANTPIPGTGEVQGRLAMWWKRATSGSESNPTVTRTGDTGTDTGFQARAYIVRGCVRTGDPWDDAQAAGYGTANGAFPALTILSGASARMAVQFLISHDDQAAGAAPAGWTAGTAATSATGTDVGFQTFRKDNISASTGADASNVAAPVQGAYLFVGLMFKPPPDQTVAIAEATQTGTAQALGKAKHAAVAQATSAATAQSVGRSKTRTLAQALETLAAQIIDAVFSSNDVPVGTATSTEAGQALGRMKTRAVVTAQEVGASQALGRAKLRAVAQATMLETAQALARGKLRAVGQAAAAEIAQVLARAKRRVLAQATTAEAAQPVARHRTRAVGTASGQEQAQALARAKVKALAQAVETQAAQAVARLKARAVAQAAELDAAQPVAFVFGQTLGTALEQATAQAVGRAKVRALAGAAEALQTLSVAARKAREVATAGSAEQVGALGRGKVRAIGTVLESDTAQALVIILYRGLEGILNVAAKVTAWAVRVERRSDTAADGGWLEVEATTEVVDE